MYKNENSMLLDLLKLSLKNKDFHYYNTRFAPHISSINHYNSDILKLSYIVVGPNIWNDIPVGIQ